MTKKLAARFAIAAALVALGWGTGEAIRKPPPPTKLALFDSPSQWDVWPGHALWLHVERDGVEVAVIGAKSYEDMKQVIRIAALHFCANGTKAGARIWSTMWDNWVTLDGLDDPKGRVFPLEAFAQLGNDRL